MVFLSVNRDILAPIVLAQTSSQYQAAYFQRLCSSILEVCLVTVASRYTVEDCVQNRVITISCSARLVPSMDWVGQGEHYPVRRLHRKAALTIIG